MMRRTMNIKYSKTLLAGMRNRSNQKTTQATLEFNNHKNNANVSKE